MIFVEGKLLSHVTPYFFTVTCQHNCFLDTQLLELGDGIDTVVLDLVVDDDVSCIFPVDGYMYDGTHMMAVMPLGSDGIHHLRITYTDDVVAHLGTDTMTCNLLHIAD